jgi:polyisoprenoid-binding protein YceI
VTVLSSTERQSSIEVGGRLTLHGVTSDLAIRAQLFPSDDVQRVSGEFPLRQSDYRITRVSVAGGTLKVKDDLVCTFDIVARRQE